MPAVALFPEQPVWERVQVLQLIAEAGVLPMAHPVVTAPMAHQAVTVLPTVHLEVAGTMEQERML